MIRECSFCFETKQIIIQVRAYGGTYIFCSASCFWEWAQDTATAWAQAEEADNE